MYGGRRQCSGVAALLLGACGVFTMPHALAAEAQSLSELSLEELMNVEVTTVSKKPEKQSEAPAAVYVITQEDIRRSGATTLPDVLRMVPGVYVARLDANKWSVTIRGSSGRYANKLQVLIDGRSVYTPLYSGVEWEIRHVMPDDIERIEVIRGPGGTLWGANAVNGVINIVTKNAADTQGGQAEIHAGTEEAGIDVRYGGRANDQLAYRVFSDVVHTSESRYSDGSGAEDHWRHGHGGFRLDWQQDDDALTLLGDAYLTDTFQRYQSSRLLPRLGGDEVHGEEWTGGSLLGRWIRQLKDDEEIRLQAYYDHAKVHSTVLDEYRDIVDLDFQHRLRLNENHELVWGVGYRFTYDQLGGSPEVSLDDPSRTYHLLSLFLQDEIHITDKLRLWLGSKVEYNSFSGLEVQPSVLLAFRLNDTNTLWASVSRAVRTPSRMEDGGRLVSKRFPGGEITLYGDEQFDSEKLIAYEFGYRWNAGPRLAFDLATYYQDYTSLRSLQFRRPFVEFRPRPRLIVPVLSTNNAEAQAYGAELAVEFAPAAWWRSRLAYSWLEMDVQPPARDVLTATLDGDSPEHQIYLQNLMSFGKRWELDTTFRYVDELPSLAVDDYLTFDLRVAYKAAENLEIAIVGQNLLEPRHAEFAPTFVNTLATDVERSVYAEIKWRF